MRRPLLLVTMEPFNDWDLQAVVRSCSSFAHHADEEPAGADGAAAALHEAAAQEPVAPAPAPPPPPDVAVQERRRAQPRVAPVVTTGRASSTAAEAAPSNEQQEKAASRTTVYGLEYLDLVDRKPFLLPPSTNTAACGEDGGREVMISFPAASTSGVQSRGPPGRKAAGPRTPRPKRSKKSQLKKVVREMPVADGVGVSSSDPWAWRKYGQKPIKGSPYPRGYYKCSSMKGCMARKLVERSPAKPGVLIVTYMAEHCHPVPTQLNALAGTTRHTAKSSSSAAAAAGEDDSKPAASSPKSHHEQGDEAAARCDAADDSNEASTAPAPQPPVAAAECGGGTGGAEEAAALADDESDFWPAEMDMDELLAPADDDFDFEAVLDEDDGVLGRRLSL